MGWSRRFSRWRTAALALFVALTGAAHAAERRFTPAELREDFALLRSALEEGNPDLYRYTPRRGLGRIFDRASARLDHDMTSLELYRIAAPVVAAARHGHQLIHLDRETYKALAAEPQLPLGVEVIDGRAFVIRDFSGAVQPLTGAEIESVNGRPAAAIVDVIADATAIDAGAASARDRLTSGWRFIIGLQRYADIHAPFELSLKQDGRSRAVRIDGRTDIAEQWTARFPADPDAGVPRKARLEFPRPEIAVLSIPHWDYEEDGKTKPSEAYEAWAAEIARRAPRALIVDLRDSGGGDEALATLLMTHLLDRPFAHYDCAVFKAAKYAFLSHAVGESAGYAAELPNYEKPASGRCRKLGAFELTNRPNLGVQQPRAPVYRGRLLLLTNAGTFSTGAEFASLVRSHRRGVIIGSAPHGGYYGNASGMVPTIELPHTRLQLEVPLVAYHLAVRPAGPPRTDIRPDVPVRYTAAERIAGVDKEMAAALRLAR